MTDEQGGPGNRSRRQMIFHALQRGMVVLVLLVAVIGVWFYFDRASHEPEAVVPPASDPVAVSVVTLAPQTIPLSPRFVGQTEASQVVEIRARVDGFLEERAFEEGEVVEQGARLYQIDPRSYQAELEVARSRKAAAEARQAQARQDLDQIEQLVSRNAATQQELDDARTAAAVAAAEVQLESARIAQAALDVSYTAIESPMRGVIGESLKDVGAYVAPGAESLLAVVSQLDPIYVRYSVSETEALRWQSGVERGAIAMPDLSELDVMIELADGREYAHAGRINYVDVKVDPTTGTRVVRAEVPNPEGLLTPGQSVHVTLRGATRTGALLVPQGAVMQTPTGATVYVVADDGTVETRAVELGNWIEDEWVIESGLSSGDRVVVDQLMKMRPGIAVETVEASAPEASATPDVSMSSSSPQ